MARLVVPDGSGFDLAGQEVLVGRGERELTDPPKINVGPLRGATTVSRRHARFRAHAGRWYLLVEPHSTNPTLVDGHLVPKGTEVPLGDGSRIQLGEVALTFQTPANGQGADATVVPEERRVVEPIVSTEPPAAMVPEAPGQPSVTWASRLPAQPAALNDLGLEELTRVNPFRGLMIDEQTWADAHDYHRDAARLHALSAHGWGVVQGLEVVADPDAPDTLVVRPGVAIDRQGRTLLLSQPVRLLAAGQDGQTRYVVLRYGEETTSPQRFWSDEDEHTRLVERSRVSLERIPPSGSAVELARVVVSATVQDALDPASPRAGEIDLRFRERAAVRPPPELAVAQLVLPDDDGAESAFGHRLGLRFLLREVGLTTSYRARWSGVVRLGDPLPSVALLYFSGSGSFDLDDEGLGHVRAFVESGGVLLADPCRSQRWEQFAASVRSLAGRLGLTLQPVVRWHPLLTSRHVLPEAAARGDGGEPMAEAGGIVLTATDLGCAWRGGSLDRELSRDEIRDALELGTNVAVFARQRQNPLDVLELEL